MTSAIHRANLVALSFEEFGGFRELGGEEIEVRKARNDLTVFHTDKWPHRGHHDAQREILEVVRPVGSDDALVVVEVYLYHDGF